ncbi:MAG: DUF1015 domain-containing protein [Anaerolineae bacterium]|nr:DUF1015 domain-containing protein [Anaerolineae bacterium]
MVKVKPFRGLRYNPDGFCDLSDVITAPYDRIHEQEQTEYYEQSAYNFTRIIQGLTTPQDDEVNNVYTRAHNYVQNWQAEKVLIRDPEPALYVIEQRFLTADGKEHVRRGLTAALELSHFDEGVVLPHEYTLRGPKIDRLKLTQATQTCWGHIFMLYADEQQVVNHLLQPFLNSHMPAIVYDKVIEPDVEQNFWVINDAEVITAVTEKIQKHIPYIIADGHHRYETALTYRDEMREKYPGASPDAAFNYVMVTLVSLNDPGLVVLPTHRLIYDYTNLDSQTLLNTVSRYFDVQRIPDLASAREFLADAKPELPRYGFYDGAYAGIALKSIDIMAELFPEWSGDFRQLDVAVLHELVIERLMGLDKESVARKENLTYLRDLNPGLKAVDQGDANFLFMLNPTRIEQIQACTAAGERMPQKSTDFFPKVPSGLVALPLYDELT